MRKKLKAVCLTISALMVLSTCSVYAGDDITGTTLGPVEKQVEEKDGYQLLETKDSLTASFEQPHTLEVIREGNGVIKFGNVVETSGGTGYVEKTQRYGVRSSATYTITAKATSNFQGYSDDEGLVVVDGATVDSGDVLQLVQTLEDKNASSTNVPQKMDVDTELHPKMLQDPMSESFEPYEYPVTGTIQSKHTLTFRANPVIGIKPAKNYKASIEVMFTQK